MKRQLLRASGSAEDLPGPLTIEQIAVLINAPQGLDTVNLRHLGEPPWVMVVDDTGMGDGRPVNEAATRLYWANCIPGTTHPICGDVVIVPDSDYGTDTFSDHEGAID